MLANSVVRVWFCEFSKIIRPDRSVTAPTHFCEYRSDSMCTEWAVVVRCTVKRTQLAIWPIWAKDHVCHQTTHKCHQLTHIPLANAIDSLIISLSIAKLLIKNKPQNKNQEKIYLLRLNDILNVVRALVLIARSGYHRCVFCGTLIGCDVRSCYHHSFH